MTEQGWGWGGGATSLLKSILLSGSHAAVSLPFTDPGDLECVLGCWKKCLLLSWQIVTNSFYGNSEACYSSPGSSVLCGRGGCL